MRASSLYKAYLEGVVSFVNYGVEETGMNIGHDELHDAREQGRVDAQNKRVMSRTEFDRETLLRRVEVRKVSA